MSPPSAIRGFLALVRFTFRRQWRTRALGLVAFLLLALMAAAVGIVTHVRNGWRIETRGTWVSDINSPGAVRMTYQEYATNRLPIYQMLPGPPLAFAMRTLPITSFQFLMLSEQTKQYRDEFEFVNFSRWIMFGMYLSFLLPLFMLAFASNALGQERETRTMIWLTTRPLPRWAVYVAKYLGVLPWCLLIAMASFLALCLAGGALGQKAIGLFWPTVLVGSLALSALFHLIGAVFRRPAVVGLVYIFFFETLVANLPGSLKRMSLNYYIRSLVYNDLAEVAASVKPENVDVYQPMTSESCWLVLLIATVMITALGAWLFSRLEPKDDL